jgi:hypothetical protein
MKNRLKVITLFVSTLLILNISIAKADSTYAVLDSNGNVTNIIVCGSACAGGEFGGNRVVPQVAADPVSGEARAGYWYGEGTTTYSENGLFTLNDSSAKHTKSEFDNSETGELIKSSVTFEARAHSFRYEDTVGNDLSDLLKESAPTKNTGIEMSVESNDNKESITFKDRKTELEILSEITLNNLMLIKSKINKLLSMMSIWMK